VIEILLEAERALSVGQLDHAERLYRQASDADPRNSIAVVGLARVALERSDDLGAYLLARKALTVDPENDAARRLAVRLLEIMRTRGDEVTGSMASLPPSKERQTEPRTAEPPRGPGPVARSQPEHARPALQPKRRSIFRRLLGR
jgi:thioredoxin-like negative regulator of GroEL